ncbi:MAG: glutathione synthetase [Alteromonadaceae bacterium]|nr:glutathione synthetase [Alteromonadaceae bacterium]
MNGTKIAIATCEQWPKPPKSLRCLSDALTKRGSEVRFAPWQNASAFKGADLVLPLAAWDYTQNPDDFLNWLSGLHRQGITVRNSPNLIRWNLNKRYLQSLAESGIATVASVHLTHPSSDDLAQAALQLGADTVVIKPACGQSGNDVQRLNVDELAGMRIPGSSDHGVLVQPFIHSVESEGEVSVCCMGGRFAHAVRRQTADNEWRANSRYGVSIEPFSPPPHLKKQAERLLASLPEIPLYARVDFFFTHQKSFILSELELIEPALFLELYSESVERLADTIESDASPEA